MRASYNSCFVFRNTSCLPFTTGVVELAPMGMGKRIQEARDRRGWSTTKLAAEADAIYRRQPGIDPAQTTEYVTQQNISVMENRDSNKSDFAGAIAEALGVSLRWLVTGHGRSDDPDWPFPLINRRLWDACNDAERGYVQGAANRALSDLRSKLHGEVSASAKALATPEAPSAGRGLNPPPLPGPLQPESSPRQPSKRSVGRPTASAKLARKS